MIEDQPVRPVRQDGWTPARRLRFLAALEECADVSVAARVCGMSRQSPMRCAGVTRHSPGNGMRRGPRCLPGSSANTWPSWPTSRPVPSVKSPIGKNPLGTVHMCTRCQLCGTMLSRSATKGSDDAATPCLDLRFRLGLRFRASGIGAARRGAGFGRSDPGSPRRDAGVEDPLPHDDAGRFAAGGDRHRRCA